MQSVRSSAGSTPESDDGHVTKLAKQVCSQSRGVWCTFTRSRRIGELRLPLNVYSTIVQRIVKPFLWCPPTTSHCVYSMRV